MLIHSVRRTALLSGALLLAVASLGSATARRAADARAAAVSVVPAHTEAVRHVRLVRSFPMADSILTTSPDAIRLWWSEPVELPMTKVELTDAAKRPIALGTIERASADDAPAMARIPKALPAGSYTVSWKTMSKDGHAMKGTFAFRVRAAATRPIAK